MSTNVSENHFASIVMTVFLSETLTNKESIYARFEVFTAVTVKNAVFWDVTVCGSCKTRRLRGTSSLQESRGVLSKKAAFFNESILGKCKNLLFSVVSRPDLHPTQPSIQGVTRTISSGVKRPGLQVATHFDAVTLSRILERCPHSCIRQPATVFI
jgi:hypothetical protein